MEMIPRISFQFFDQSYGNTMQNEASSESGIAWMKEPKYGSSYKVWNYLEKFRVKTMTDTEQQIAQSLCNNALWYCVNIDSNEKAY